MAGFMAKHSFSCPLNPHKDLASEEEGNKSLWQAGAMCAETGRPAFQQVGPIQEEIQMRALQTTAR